jgi:hypothetical protein
LWTRANRHGRIKFIQTDLSIEVGVSTAHFCRIIREMTEAGRLRPLPGPHAYLIIDPAVWMAQRIKDVEAELR